MVDRTDITFSDSNKSIANNLFPIELKQKRNLKRVRPECSNEEKKKDELLRWSKRFIKLNELRNKIVPTMTNNAIIPKDAGELSY